MSRGAATAATATTATATTAATATTTDRAPQGPGQARAAPGGGGRADGGPRRGRHDHAPARLGLRAQHRDPCRLSGVLEQAVDRWLGDLFPELGTDPPTPGRAAVTSVVTGQLLAVFLEEMLLGDGHGDARIARRAAAAAEVVFPAPRPTLS